MTKSSGPWLSALSLLCVILSIGGCACAGSDAQRGTRSEGSLRRAQTLTIKGSDTMVILAQRWAEQYMKEHPEISVQVSGGGSGTGIAALINGTTDLATASRAMRTSEAQALVRAGKAAPVQHQVAIDALAVYVQHQNPISALPLADVKAIFRGFKRNWREVGGFDKFFVLYSRENNSGTYEYFKEHVLEDEDFAPEAQTLPGTAAVIHAVSRDPGSIGYGGIGFGANVRALSIVDAHGERHNPTLEEALSGSYPLSRFLYMYTAGEPTGIRGEFIQWIRSTKGQTLVAKAGFFPLKEGLF